MANKLKLHSISMRNFLSYGDNLTQFNFEDGFNLIKGANGNGKSTIIEAIFFALFGKSYRELTLNEIVNSYNGRNCYVKLELTRSNAGVDDTFVVERGLKPKLFRIMRNGIALNEEGTGGVFQQYLQNEVLGFNEILFRNSIAIASSSSTPFLHMGAADKRKLIESILGISDLEKIKKAFAGELSDAKSQLRNTSSQLPILSGKISELREILAQALREKDTDISRLKLELNEYESTLIAHQEELTAISHDMQVKAEEGKTVALQYEGYKKLHTELGLHETQLRHATKEFEKSTAMKSELLQSIECNKGFNKKGLEKLEAEKNALSQVIAEGEKLEQDFAVLRFKLSEQETQLEKLLASGVKKSVGDCCPTCGKPTTEEDVALVQKQFNADVKALKASIVKLKSQCSELDEKSQEHKQNRDNYQLLSKKLTEYSVNMSKYERDKKQLEYVDNEINSHQIEIDLAKKELEIIRPKIQIADVLSSQLTALRTEYFEIKSKYDSKNTIIESTKKRISSLNEVIKEKETKNVDDVIKSTQDKIDKSMSDYSLAKDEVSKWSDEIEMLEYISTIFGDEGIKEYMMKKYVPLLNDSIHRYMTKFGLPYSVSFDSMMELTFVSGAGQSKSYKGLSGGQRMRVDFSIYMAFRDFVNKIGRFKINVFFLDEMLDTAVDGTGYADMMGIVRGMAPHIGSVYLISHRADESNEIFDSLIEMQHDGMFSSFTIRKH